VLLYLYVSIIFLCFISFPHKSKSLGGFFFSQIGFSLSLSLSLSNEEAYLSLKREDFKESIEVWDSNMNAQDKVS
jgi:hypothetical protein